MRRRNPALTPEILRRLEAMALAVRRHHVSDEGYGAGRGGRWEFRGHRAYSPGDELRDLDWAAYARTGQPVIKTYGSAKITRISLVLDLSPSMQLPGKAEFTLQLASVLAHVALAAGDRLQIWPADGGEPSPVRRGLQFSQTCRDWLDALSETGPADWSRVLTRIAQTPPGAILMLSDFWTEQFPAALNTLHSGRHDVFFMHILSPDEYDPQLNGYYRLRDAESGEEMLKIIGTKELSAYRAALQEKNQRLSEWSRRYAGQHFLCRSDLPGEQVAMKYLRAQLGNAWQTAGR